MNQDGTIDYSPSESAELRDASRARPKLVWAIGVFYVLGALINVLSYSLVFTDYPGMPADVREKFAALTGLDHALVSIGLLLNVTAAVYLFQLRRLAPYLFTAGLGLTIVSWAWQLAVGRIGKELLQNHLFASTAGTVIAVLVCAYSWSLLRRGYLR